MGLVLVLIFVSTPIIWILGFENFGQGLMLEWVLGSNSCSNATILSFPVVNHDFSLILIAKFRNPLPLNFSPFWLQQSECRGCPSLLLEFNADDGQIGGILDEFTLLTFVSPILGHEICLFALFVFVLNFLSSSLACLFSYFYLVK